MNEILKVIHRIKSYHRFKFNLFKHFKKFQNSLLNIFFPEKCFGCGRKNILLCQSCLNNLPVNVENNRFVLAATSYRSKTIQKAIWALKYKKAKKLSKPLAELVFERVLKFYSSSPHYKNAVLVPIPLSKKRLRKRGFNQAELIAENLAKLSSLKMETKALWKIKETPSQVKIKEKEKRLKNLKGAFVVKNPDLIKNKTIFVIDDVSTTGTTIKEARYVLKKAGAKKVIGLVVAKG